MANIIGIRFKKAGKIYFFDPAGNQVNAGEHVIVETAMGMEYGEVVIANRQLPQEKIVAPLKKIIRVATRQDAKQNEENKKFRLLRTSTNKLKLNIKDKKTYINHCIENGPYINTLDHQTSFVLYISSL